MRTWRVYCGFGGILAEFVIDARDPAAIRADPEELRCQFLAQTGLDPVHSLVIHEIVPIGALNCPGWGVECSPHYPTAWVYAGQWFGVRSAAVAWCAEAPREAGARYRIRRRPL